jgi:very-short-patch-repair endonuclease
MNLPNNKPLIINRKILDFVVFEKKYISPVLVIELDDSSHNSMDRKQRDELVDSVMMEAKIGIMHVPSQYNYNIQELTSHITDALKDFKEFKKVGK